MIFKTEQELREVISLGKPEEVINVFLESYLQGLEYEKYKNTYEDMKEVLGLISELNYDNLYEKMSVSLKDNWASDENKKAVENELSIILLDIKNNTENSGYTSLFCDYVEIGIDEFLSKYKPVDVSEQMKQWKLDNYQILRKPIYPDIAEYIDAMVKGDNNSILEYIDKCLAVKEKYPKVIA